MIDYTKGPDGYHARLQAKIYLYGKDSNEVNQMVRARQKQIRDNKIDKLLTDNPNEPLSSPT